MKKLALFLLVFLMSISCTGLYSYHSVSPPTNNQHFRTFPIYIDKSFDDKELAVIGETVNEWNYALNSYMAWKIEPTAIDSQDLTSLKILGQRIKQTHEGLMMLGLNHDSELLEDIIDEYDGTLAFVNDLGDRAHLMVVIRDRIGQKNLHKILLHEFGHAMGANHVMAPSLMYPYYGYKQIGCIDKITIAQVAGYFNLNAYNLNYCSTPFFN